MRRLFPIVVVILLFALIGMTVWISNQLDEVKQSLPTRRANLRSATPGRIPPSSDDLVPPPAGNTTREK